MSFADEEYHDDYYDDFEDDSEDDGAKKPQKSGAKPKASDGNQKTLTGMDYFMKKAGKTIEESSEIEFTDEEDQEKTIAQVEDSGKSLGASLDASQPKKSSAPAT